MKDKTKHLLTRVLTVTAAAAVIYGYISLPTDGLDYYHNSYSTADGSKTKTETPFPEDIYEEISIPDRQETDIPSDAETEDSISVKEEEPATEINDDTDYPLPETDKEEQKEEPSQPTESEDTVIKQKGNIALTDLTFEVKRGGNAGLRIKGLPNTEYSIYVYYSSGVSQAKGLETKISDGQGYVEWQWKVGVRTKPGSYEIEITDGKTTLKTEFEVS